MLLVGPEIVFGNIDTSFGHFKHLLSSLSRTDVLLWCGRLNLIVANPNITHEKRQEYFMRNFLEAEEIERINNYTTQQGGTKRVSIISRAAILECIRWACLLCQDHANDGESFEDSVTRKVFARIIFLAGQVWSNRRYEPGISADNLPVLRKAVEDNQQANGLYTSIGRGMTLYGELMPRYYKGMSEKFYSITGLTLKQYYLCLSFIMAQFVHIDPDKADFTVEKSGLFYPKYLINSMTDEAKAIMTKFIDFESQTVDDLKSGLWGDADGTHTDPNSHFDHTPLKRKAILRAPRGQCLILDAVYFTQRATDGPFFIVADSLKEDKSGLNRLTSSLGYSFESYVCNILDDMGRHVNGQHIRKFMGHDVAQNQQEVEISDYCIIDGYDMALFESKAVVMPDRIIDAEKPEKYLKEILMKYGRADSEFKGAGQLARSISKIASKEWIPKRSIGQVFRLYPILLVHDSLIDAPGHMLPLARAFYEALAPEYIYPLQQSYKKGAFTVMPLIVLDIDDLEKLQCSVTKYRLMSLFLEYSHERRGRVLGFNDYVARSKYGFYLNSYMADKTAALCREILASFFRAPKGSEAP